MNEFVVFLFESFFFLDSRAGRSGSAWARVGCSPLQHVAGPKRQALALNRKYLGYRLNTSHRGHAMAFSYRMQLATIIGLLMFVMLVQAGSQVSLLMRAAIKVAWTILHLGAGS
jgi:hypothetical protein